MEVWKWVKKMITKRKNQTIIKSVAKTFIQKIKKPAEDDNSGKENSDKKICTR